MRKGYVVRRMWEEISHLNQVWTIRWERRKNEGKKKKEKKTKERGRKDE